MSTKRLITEDPINNGLSVPKTSMFIVGAVAGTGVLALPKALEDTGWIGIPLLIFYIGISTYTGVIIGRSWSLAGSLFEECRGQVSDPYPLLGEKTYGKTGRYLVGFFMNFSLFGSATVFLILASSNLQLIGHGLGSNLSSCYWALIISACLLPFTWFGTPKDFWLIALGAASSTAIACVILLVLMALPSSEKTTTVSHGDVQLDRFSISLGTMMFSLAGHPGFLTYQADMKRQSDFKWAVIPAYATIGCLYLPVAVVGYFLYGDKLDANILETVPSGPLTVTVTILVTIHVVTAYIICLNPVFQHLETFLNIPKSFTWKRCVSRLFVVCVLLFVAETIPKFDAVLSFVGGFAYAFLDYVFPVIFYIRLCKLKKISEKQNIETMENSLQIEELDTLDTLDTSTPLWMKTLNYEIIFVGVVTGLIATVSALVAIVSPNSFTVPCYIDPQAVNV